MWPLPKIIHFLAGDKKGHKMAHDLLRADKAPKHLSRDAKRIWRQINSTWDLQNAPDALLILRTALESFDRLQQARSVLDIEGVTVKSKTATGDIKILKHPALEAEKSARGGLLQAFRMLGLEFEASGLTGRRGN
jgi:P27 family predicted phage terminase small subunit